MSHDPTALDGDSDRVAEIRQRLEAATPGEWIAYDPDAGTERAGRFGCVAIPGLMHPTVAPQANAALIAAAPADIAWLLSRLAVVEAERDELRAKLDRTWREATPAFRRLHAALDETGREVEAPAGDDLWRYGWAEGYTVTRTTLRRALSGTTEGPS